MIAQLPAWDEENEAPNLTGIEDEVLRLRQRFGQALVDSQAAQQPVETPHCERCGAELRYKGSKRRAIASRVGEVAIERGYYYCACCQSGLFPLDRQLELGGGVWSEGVLREVAYLSGAVPSFELAKALLQRLAQIAISQPSTWRCAQAVEAAERDHANAQPEQLTPPSRAAVTDHRQGVALDGVNVHIREEGWKEVKIGAVFDVEVRPTPDDATGELVDLAHAVANRYVAHLGGPDVVGEKTWALARRHGWEQAQDTLVLVDGAPWIWNQAALHFGQSHQLVDWYHAKEHLVAAGRLLKGKEPPPAPAD